MNIKEFYNLCDKLNMIDDEDLINHKIPSSVPEIICFLRELVTYNDTNCLKDLLFCMIEKE